LLDFNYNDYDFGTKISEDDANKELVVVVPSSLGISLNEHHILKSELLRVLSESSNKKELTFLNVGRSVAAANSSKACVLQ
jgi:hypothetical protein